MPEPQMDRSEQRIKMLEQLLAISKKQLESIRDSIDPDSLESYLEWSRRFTEQTKQLDFLQQEGEESLVAAQDKGTIKHLLEQIESNHQQCETMLRDNFNQLTSELKTTRQSKSAVSAYYGNKNHVSIYFDQKQ